MLHTLNSNIDNVMNVLNSYSNLDFRPKLKENDLEGIIKELEAIKGDVKINDAAIKFLDAKIEELKAELDNPLL